MTNKQIPHLLRLLIIAATFFAQQVLAAQALPEFSAKYAIQKFGVKLAEAHYQLSYTDSGYKFTQQTELYGVASLFANDTVSAASYIDKVGDNLLLTEHHYTQTGREENKDETFSIHWNTPKNTLSGKVTGIVRSKEIELHTGTEVWEALSFQIPLMIEANEDIKEYPYRAIIKGEIDDYIFVLTSNKKIQFAGKEYKSIQLVRTDPEKNRQLHLWLIPELDNIPVIIENYRNGKEHSRMQQESVSFNKEITYSEQQAEDDDDI